MAEGYGFEVTISNGLTHRITSIDIQLPQIRTRYDEANRVYVPLRGGQSTAWNAGEWGKGQGNSSMWPSTAFSPIVTLWNEKTQETLGITFFSRTLTPAMVYWASGPTTERREQQMNPFLRLLPGLEPGQTLTVRAEYVEMKGGPAAHQKKYREEVLAPFMKEAGIPEAAGLPEKGPIAEGPTVERGHMRATLASAQALGVSTYIQWSPPDGSSEFYNPYAAQLPWFQELAVSKEFPAMKVGVLINPFITPPLKSDAFALKSPHTYTNLKLDLAAPANREYAARLRDELVKRGISVAFWDTGNGPEQGKTYEWLKLLANWKRAGIAIMPETSCDLAAWTTGLWMEFPYSWGDYGLAKTVCPQATLAAHTNSPDVREGVDWKEDAVRKGVQPILDLNDMLKARKK